MATYVEVAQALYDAGYLSEADIDAAAAVLADPLAVDYYDGFYASAAQALLDGEYIDEVNLDAVALAIDGVWVIE